PTTHVIRVQIDEDAPERERRTALLLHQSRPPALPTVVVPDVLEDCHPLVTRISKRLMTRSCDPGKLVTVSGRDIFAVHVSQSQRDRALRILEGCLVAFLSAGAELIPAKQDGDPLHLRILDQFV